MNRLVLFLLAVFVLIGSPVQAQDTGAEAILNVLAESPHNVSLVVYSLDDPENGLYHNANVMRPLATTVKILVLAEYARRVADGMLDPEELVPLDSVETYYFPGTDRGAHVLAVTELRNAGRLENDELTLAEIADAMIRFNDNAAADYLMLRFGREAMDALPERLGLRYAEPPVPISGIYLNWDFPYNITDDATNLPNQDE
ncbi:MAG: serine hydrolase, partial [Bacteroidetes bacterium]|nr:serine hydrolase [Bacteroidota bacterium]